MFTLKLYRNGPLPPDGRTVILECAGVWVDECENGVKHIQAFKKTVGIQDEDYDIPDFYVGGNLPPDTQVRSADDPPPAIVRGAGGNYYSWGVLENAQGKTTEMFR
jgi:hypothetical protein